MHPWGAITIFALSQAAGWEQEKVVTLDVSRLEGIIRIRSMLSERRRLSSTCRRPINWPTWQGFTSLGDIVNYTPGINTSQGEGHRDAIVFRGVRSTADFFIDGVRDDIQYYRPLYNLEQVEILRGPNALHFGRGGTGGILNRVTKKGVIGANFSGYQASIDSFGEFAFQVDSNNPVDENSAVPMHFSKAWTTTVISMAVNGLALTQPPKSN